MPHSRDTFAATVEIEVDRVCTAFDRALRNGESPRVEDYLAGFEGNARKKLLAGLLALEIDHRVAQGDPPSLTEYRDRFPEDAPIAKSIYIDSVTPTRIGRFKVEAILGKGGFGRVYRAYDDTLKRHVAIKMLIGRGQEHNSSVQVLLQEAQLAARLKHAAIVPVYEFGQDEDGDHFVVLEYIEGTTLAHARDEYGLSRTQLLKIAVTVADALQYAHERGLTHRDLKPANILVDQEHRPYVTDFGLAIDESMQGILSGAVVGTPPYMAPEQVAGETHRVDGRTDIWGFGVILYELFTGSRPFVGSSREELFYQIRHLDPKPPRQRDGTIPIRLERIIVTCLAKRMSDRYSSAAELATALRSALTEFDGDHARLASSVASQHWSGAQQGSMETLPKVVPKGLRSFDRQDASFFIRLLPGPRDSDGLPEPIRFWQTRINDTDENSTFPIGLLYGPSGCGKSSFVKAGLIPKLAEHVIPIVIESTRDETELRLLKAIRKLYGDIPAELALPEIIAEIREGRWAAPGQKLLIVLDQFEQWLHANPVQEASQLSDALRQCDGGRVQTLLLVRDDFWMQVTRLLHLLEVPLLEGRNSGAVDLFDLRHAIAVLGEFGVAYGKLPSQIDDWSDEQRQFIERAAKSVAVDGRVVPVRLALLAELIKARYWTAKTLKEIGGAEGTGVAFLEETFNSRTASPERRMFRTAARAVLECLLPPEGTDIRGNMQPEQVLIDRSGYAHSRHEFDRLINILDAELRLITPTDPTGLSRDDDSSVGNGLLGERHYQLTHDYLVPAIRTWLTRGKRATARGRAELRLSERAAAYHAQCHVRQLPNVWEWLSIVALTRSRDYQAAERQLLAAANRHHVRRLGAIAMAVVVVSWIAYEANGRLRAAGFMRTLAAAETADVPQLVREIPPLRRWMDSRLHERFAAGNEKEHLHAAMALLPVDPTVLDDLVKQLFLANADSIEPVREVIFEYGDRDAAGRTLWSALTSSGESPPRRLRAAIGLAQDHFANDPRWSSVSDELFEAWIDDVVANPSNFDRWLQLLRPLGSVFQEPADRIFADARVDRQKRYLVAAILAGLRQDRPDQLVELTVEADSAQFRPLQSALVSHTAAALPLLTNVFKQSTTATDSEDEQDHVARRQANAAVCLFELGRPEPLDEALATVTDGNRHLQTWSIDRFSRASSGEGTLRQHLQHALAMIDRETSTSSPAAGAELSFAAALVIGNLAEQPWSGDYRSRVVALLERAFLSHGDAGVHSAAEWALRQWAGDETVSRLRSSLCGKPPMSSGGWYVDSTCHTMSIVAAPGKTTIGAPEREPGREKDEAQRQVEIGYAFCASTTEITQADFCRLMPELSNRFPNDFSVDAESPANDVTFTDAMKYCRRLSEAAGLPEDEMCYPATSEIGNSFTPDVRLGNKRSGYRLLTNSEWEYVCRAGSSSPRFYGYAPQLLDEYAWYLLNSGGQAHPVGLLKPNRLGLFDVYGNVREWTTYPTAFLSKMSTVRGGPYSASARMLRSANWRADKIDYRGYTNGFRIARTWKGPE